MMGYGADVEVADSDDFVDECEAEEDDAAEEDAAKSRSQSVMCVSLTKVDLTGVLYVLSNRFTRIFERLHSFVGVLRTHIFDAGLNLLRITSAACFKICGILFGAASPSVKV